jgi:hypothetical protein
VRGNGGGSICLGYQVISALITERNPIGHYDIKENALIDALVAKVWMRLGFFNLDSDFLLLWLWTVLVSILDWVSFWVSFWN